MKIKRWIEEEVKTSPCPFCGSEDVSILHSLFVSAVTCNKCKSVGPSVASSENSAKDEQLILTKWNIRSL